MKILPLGLLVSIYMLLNGCLYGQCMDGPCALERARMIKSIKAYGQFWTKPGMSTESWRQDWVACGGKQNGSYAVDVPQFSETEIIIASSERIRQKLDACMKAKGYEFSYGNTPIKLNSK